MKTSPELLTSILATLGTISTKMDSMNAKTKKGGTGGVLGVSGMLGTLIKGKKAGDGITAMADSIKKLNEELKKTNIKKLNSLINSIANYEKIQKESSSRRREKSRGSLHGLAASAKDMGMALVLTAAGVAAFVGVIWLAKNKLQMSPYEVLGFVATSMVVLAFAMIVIAGADAAGTKMGRKTGLAGLIAPPGHRGRGKEATKSAKDMGIALMFIAGGILAFAVTLMLVPLALGITAKGAKAPILGMAVIIGVITAIGGIFYLLGKFRKDIGIGVLVAVGVALGMAAIGWGVMQLANTAKKMQDFGKGGEATKKTGEKRGIFGQMMAAIGPGLGMIGIIFVSATALFGLLGLLATTGTGGIGALALGVGIATAIGVAYAMDTIGTSVLKLANTAKQLQDFGKGGEATKPSGDKKGMFGQMMAGIGPGLGMIGVIFASATALFATLGVLATVGTLGIGALALGAGIGIAIGVGTALIKVAESVKTVDDVTKGIGGVTGMKNISKTIEIMIGAVTTSVIKGVMGEGGVDKNNNDKLSLAEIRRFRRIRRIVRMVGNISSSLTKFAQGLRAFAKLGEISSLDYEEKEIKDEDGNVIGTEMKPIIGGTKIHVTVIAKAIADTFGLFIKTLVTNTDTMRLGQGAALKRLSKALTGGKGGGGGLISGVAQFADTLKTFSQFGAEQKIWVPPQYDGPEGETDPKKRGKLIAGTGVSVPIQVISDSIVSTFGSFVEKMAGNASKFELGGVLGNKMVRFTEALMGKQRSGIGKLFAREKPGILSGITAFSEVLTTYAQYGKEGKVPVRDPKTGEVIDTMTMTDVAQSMVKSITDFVIGFESAAGSANLEAKATSVQDKITSITSIVTQFDALAATGEGVEKLANSLGLLATNIGLLVTNTSALDTTKLQSLATITAQHAVTTKGIPIAPPSPTATSKPAASNQPDWDRIADMMGQRIAEKLNGMRSGDFNFTFYDGNSGGKLEIKEK